MRDDVFVRLEVLDIVPSIYEHISNIREDATEIFKEFLLVDDGSMFDDEFHHFATDINSACSILESYMRDLIEYQITQMRKTLREYYDTPEGINNH